MKKHLLPEGRYYKANLHCHSTCSDGKLTPAELKELYKGKGYSILAITDHCLLVPHHRELTDDSFVVLNGTELDVPQPGVDRIYRKTCHMCYIALDPDNAATPFYHSEKYVFGNMQSYRDKVVRDGVDEEYERDHTGECISYMMQRGRERGYFVTYNHPTWSLEDYTDYVGFRGMHAMEMFNYLSTIAGPEDINGRVYDDILRSGNRIYCIGADDNHNGRPLGHRRFDSFGAWTMICPGKLEYTSVTDALVKGDFYASMGPEIKSLYAENGRVYIETSPAESIVMMTNVRRWGSVHREKGKRLTHADFPIHSDTEYIRFIVTDRNGKKAATNAYFTAEIIDG